MKKKVANPKKKRYNEDELIRCSCKYHRVLAVKSGGKILVKCKGCGRLIQIIDDSE